MCVKFDFVLLTVFLWPSNGSDCNTLYSGPGNPGRVWGEFMWFFDNMGLRKISPEFLRLYSDDDDDDDDDNNNNYYYYYHHPTTTCLVVIITSLMYFQKFAWREWKNTKTYQSGYSTSPPKFKRDISWIQTRSAATRVILITLTLFLLTGNVPCASPLYVQTIRLFNINSKPEHAGESNEIWNRIIT
jgi:hypothetical protein